MMRDGRLDVLRIALILAVVCIHTFCVMDYSAYPQYRTASLIVNTICHYAVPLFVMLSGIVLMNRCDEPLVDFYRKRLTRILVPTVPCVSFFVLLRILRDGDQVTLVLKETLYGHPYYHLWFAFMLIGVYGLLPFLIRLVNEIPNIILVVLGALIIYVSWRVGEGPYQLLPYAAYTLLGMVLHRRYGGGSHRIEGSLAAILLVIITIVNACVVLRSGSYWTIGYCSPFILIGSICALIAVLSLPAFNSEKVKTLSGLVFGVYLWHSFFKGVSIAVLSHTPYLRDQMWLVFPMTAACAFVSVFLISRTRVGAIILGVKGICK